eukprot:TRINITY_DN15393_c0_g1_i3.p1 TRINITY_DN15393_c0_g1~~TRINITY_DN15393_c0_g1_i3.p1  ORF type:complete len:383 (-),score=91.82 TRINITY_DN15393_c0_g1_i3:114-1160(-)
MAAALQLRLAPAPAPPQRLRLLALGSAWRGASSAQTPLFRLRREAEMRAVNLPRDALPGDTRGLGQGLDLLQPGRPSPEAGNAAELVERAFAAIRGGQAVECHALVWALRDLPRDEEVRRALSLRLVRGADGRRATLLQAAAAAGNNDAVRLLVEELPVAVDAKDAEGMTALHFAAQGNHAEVLKTLLARGRAAVNARDRHGRTALLHAAKLRHQHIVRILLRFGANHRAEDWRLDLPSKDAAVPEGVNAEEARAETKKMREWMRQFVEKRRKTTKEVGRTCRYKGPLLPGKALPSHLVAPKLIYTPNGYFPEENGKIKLLRKPIRNKKKRHGVSTPSSKVNWYTHSG